MKTVRINVPLNVVYTSLVPTDDGFHSTVHAVWGAVKVSVSGSREAVDYFLCLPQENVTLIQRALSALGYVVGDHEKLAGDGPTLPGVIGVDMRTAADDAELDEWRSAAKLCGFSSPKELADSWRETFGQFVDRKMMRDWQDATGCHDPGIAKERIKQLRVGYDSADAERSQLKRDAKQREQAWVNATDRHCPGDAEQRIDDLQMQVKMQAETIRAWKKATGAESPESAINAIGTSFDSWKEATGCANAFQAQNKIAKLESKLLSYASEIDALRKVAQATKPTEVEVELDHGTLLTANGKTIGVVYNPEREFLKAHAELQSKCREAQTERERADKAEQNMRYVAVVIDKVREALGIVGADDSDLPEHVADLKKAERDNDAIVDELRKILHAKEGESVIYAARRAIVPLPKPEKVEAGQKWAIVIGFVDTIGTPWFFGPNLEHATFTHLSSAEFMTVATYLGT